jgi:hypothetical protein
MHVIIIVLMNTDFVPGSPIKSENLPDCVHVDLSDPRPVHLRQRVDQQDQVRNLVTNYVANTGSDINARYLFSKTVDLQQTAHDHDYFTRPFTELLVIKRNEVNISFYSLSMCTVPQTVYSDVIGLMMIAGKNSLFFLCTQYTCMHLTGQPTGSRRDREEDAGTEPKPDVERRERMENHSIQVWGDCSSNLSPQHGQTL